MGRQRRAGPNRQDDSPEPPDDEELVELVELVELLAPLELLDDEPPPRLLEPE
jgi:hypothetical protein